MRARRDQRHRQIRSEYHLQGPHKDCWEGKDLINRNFMNQREYRTVLGLKPAERHLPLDCGTKVSSVITCKWIPIPANINNNVSFRNPESVIFLMPECWQRGLADEVWSFQWLRLDKDIQTQRKWIVDRLTSITSRLSTSKFVGINLLGPGKNSSGMSLAPSA